MRPRIAAAILLLCVGLGLFFRHFPTSFSTSRDAWVPQDFRAYLRASERMHLGQDPYVASDAQPYKYSPAVLVPLMLVPAVSANHDQQDWMVWLCFKAFFLSVFCFSLGLGLPVSDWKNGAALVLGLSLAWKGILEALDYGQVEFFLFGSAVLAARILHRHPVLCGVLLSVLPWVKLPWAFLICPFFLFFCKQSELARARSFGVGLLGGGLGFGLALPLFVFGWDRTVLLFHSWAILVAQQPAELYALDTNQSLWISSQRWIHSWGLLGWIASGLACGLCLWIFVQMSLGVWRAKQWPDRAGVLVALTPWFILMQLVNPLGWRAGSLFLVGVPWMIRIHHFSRIALVLLLAFLFFGQLNPLAQLFGVSHWTDLHSLGWITLYWIVALVLCYRDSESV